MLHIDPNEVRLSAYVSKIDDFLAEARALKADLLDRLAQVEQTISAFERMQQDIPADTLERILTKSDAKPEDKTQEPAYITHRVATPSEVVALSRDALLTAGTPMKRGQLVRVLEGRGATLAGSDKNKNLGTILWRHPRDFVTIEGRGYWVKGVPLKDVYDPEQDDEQLPKTTFVKARQ